MHRWRHLLHETLIVPAAHIRVLDSNFQLEIYEVFHTRGITRLVHFLCTPIVNISLLAAATALPLPAMHLGALNVDGAVVAAVIAMAGYTAVYGAWAAVMLPILQIALALAHIQATALGGHALSTSLKIAFVASLIQTLSHTIEPVPPPWSGSYGWISVKEFVRKTPPIRLVTLTLVSLGIFPWLEFWACPRIWPIQMLHLMMRAGLWPTLASRTRKRVRAIFTDARNGWTLPAERTESD